MRRIKCQNSQCMVSLFFRTHLSQLLEKLTGLLASRIASRLSAWRVRPPTPSTEIRAVCQAMAKLTETTSNVLSHETLTVSLLIISIQTGTCLDFLYLEITYLNLSALLESSASRSCRVQGRSPTTSLRTFNLSWRWTPTRVSHFFAMQFWIFEHLH